MDDQIAIKVVHLNKFFKLPHEKFSSLKSVFLNLYRRKKSYEVHHVLKDINFEVKHGEFFGIVGRNGSGKSTMLKLLAGIYAPTGGTVEVNGKLTPFIELGVGFNMELSGRENVFLNGALLGFTRREMRSMYKDIVEFAELEQFMDQKLKNYSSGMQVRLAFSIAIRAQTDILLIDEVLAVGDSNFQRKCMRIFEDLKRSGRTIVFVSHDMNSVRDFCDKVVVLEKGRVIFNGDTEKAIDLYNKLNLERESTEALKNSSLVEQERLGSGGARIEKFEISDHAGKKTNILQTGKKFTINIEVSYKNDVKNPVIGVMFRKNPQENLYGINNYYQGVNFGEKKPGDKSYIDITDTFPLNQGEYYLTLSISDARSATNYEELDLMNNCAQVFVRSEKPGWALIRSTATITEKAHK